MPFDSPNSPSPAAGRSPHPWPGGSGDPRPDLDAPLARRTMLTASGVAGLGALLAACGGSRTPAAGASASGGWSFTDDRGKTAKAASRPHRVVAFIGSAAALADCGAGDSIVGVFGPSTDSDGKTDVQAGDFDVSKVTDLGNTWGEFDVEKYASLRPDLLVTTMYEPGALWYVPDKSAKDVARLAPTVGLTVDRVALPRPMQRYRQLAAALGSTNTDRGKDAFDRAVRALRSAASANRRIRVMCASADSDLFYVSNAKIYPDLMYYRQLGIDFVMPDKVDKPGYYESLSWENADKYRADLIMLDSRSSALQPAALKSKPTWRALPAVKAGQVIGWLSEPRMSYVGMAPPIEALAKAVRGAKRVA